MTERSSTAIGADDPTVARIRFPAFQERFPWIGGDLQTLRNAILRARVRLTAAHTETLEFDLEDGSGDRLIARLDRPASGAIDGLPMVLLVHGLTGCDESLYMLATSQALLLAGYAVVRLNLRGAGPSRKTCIGHYNAGKSDDLRRIVPRLPVSLTANGVIVVGFSLGGNVVLKFLGEGAADGVKAGIAVSAPIDLAHCAEAMVRPRNTLYHHYLLRRMKHEARAGAAQLSEVEWTAIASARTVIDYDEVYVAPRGGYDGAYDYYARCSSQEYLDSIAVPTLVIHADNDPMVPVAPYRRRDWSRNPMIQPLISRGGGHVAFHGPNGRWHDDCVVAFVQGLAG